MKKHKYSDYENYILTADKCGLRLGYESFLDFKVPQMLHLETFL